MKGKPGRGFSLKSPHWWRSCAGSGQISSLCSISIYPKSEPPLKEITDSGNVISTRHFFTCFAEGTTCIKYFLSECGWSLQSLSFSTCLDTLQKHSLCLGTEEFTQWWSIWNEKAWIIMTHPPTLAQLSRFPVYTPTFLFLETNYLQYVHKVYHFTSYNRVAFKLRDAWNSLFSIALFTVIKWPTLAL